MDGRGGLSEFRNGWKVVLASATGVGVGVTGAPFYTIGIFLKPLVAEFHWSRAGVSAATLFLSTGAALTAPFVGRLADRIDVRKIALISMIGVILGFLGLTRIGADITSLYFWLAVLALAGCGTTPLVWTHAVNSWFDRSRGLSLGLTLAGGGVAAILAPRGVDRLIQAYGWQAGYVGLAVVTALAYPIILLFFHEKKAPILANGEDTIERVGLTVRQAVRSRCFWQLAIGMLLVTGAVAAILVHLVPLLTDAGLSRDRATAIAGLLGFAVLFGRVFIGLLVDRFHAPYVAAIVLTIPGIGYLLMATAPGDGWVLMLATLMFGTAAGAEADILAYLASRFFGLRAFGGIYGLLLAAFGIGAGLGPITMGRVFDETGGYGPALYAGAAACVTGAILIGCMGRYPSRNVKPAA
jgi:predicted MFS family arabinose efflux permease